MCVEPNKIFQGALRAGGLVRSLYNPKIGAGGLKMCLGYISPNGLRSQIMVGVDFSKMLTGKILTGED